MKIIYLILAILVISCQDRKETNRITADKDRTATSTQKEAQKKIEYVIEYTIDFPDTVFVNQLNDGEIKYKSVLDTIITTFGDPKKNRYTRFILTTTDNVDYDYKKLRETAKDTFGALNNREIPFYNIKFTSTGTYYIDGLIDDIILIDTITKNQSENDIVQLIRNQERVTKKVVVIKKP